MFAELVVQQAFFECQMWDPEFVETFSLPVMKILSNGGGCHAPCFVKSTRIITSSSGASLVAQLVKNLPAVCETWV